MLIKVHMPTLTRASEFKYRLTLYVGGSAVGKASLTPQDDSTVLVTDIISSEEANLRVVDGVLVAECNDDSTVHAIVERTSEAGYTCEIATATAIVDEDNDVLCFGGDEDCQIVAVVPQPESADVAEVEGGQSEGTENQNVVPNDTANSDSQSNANDTDSSGQGGAASDDLSKFNLTAHELSTLKKHNVFTLADAKAYWESNGNSFEPMSGFGEKSSKVLAVKLGLIS